MRPLAIIGCGFVADLYLRSFALHPEAKISTVYDHDPERLATFCTHWGLEAAQSQEALLATLPPKSLVLNLTNPSAHFEVNQAILSAGQHVFCEKPLAMNMKDAQSLAEQANAAGLQLGSAPASALSQAAQTMARAVRDETAGPIRLIYAELDDGFIAQAPVESWVSESGAPWPFKDEFRVGCTLEHAGYYLSWLIAMFGPVVTVVAASAQVSPDKKGVEDAAPDVSIATLFFKSGTVARLTCSIIAPHDHRIRAIGDKGVISVKQAWDNRAKVKFHRRMRIRRRLLEHPIGRRIKPYGAHPFVGRWGAASMNFALGPIEMLQAIDTGRPSRIAGDYALHLNEVTLAIQNAGRDCGTQEMTTSCDTMEPMTWG